MGWIGVDLDGTLAEYYGHVAHDIIGAPVPKMLARVKKWLQERKDVRIFTARANVPESVEAIKKWCVLHIGQELPVTNVKDLTMWQLWDDRAIQVIPNTGERVDEKLVRLQAYVDQHPYGSCSCAGEGKCGWCARSRALEESEKKMADG